jgi:glycyl-tRNA synthetase
MGCHYALASGEKEEVAAAIREHYLPASSGDPAPETKPGLVVGLADRLDSLVGLFAAGLEPTGSKDPFAQRRAALGLVGNLIHWGSEFDLGKGIQAAAEKLPISASPDIQRNCREFIIERLRNYLLDEKGAPFHIVDAVLAEQGHNPCSAARSVEELTSWTQRDDWEHILDTFARCVRILRGIDEEFSVDAGIFESEEEGNLYKALQNAEKQDRQIGSVDDFLKAFLPLIPFITSFFDEVMVNAEDENLRRNRLGLLQRIAALPRGSVDLSRMEGF